MDKKVNDYIDKQKSPQKEICQTLRELIFETFPGIKEGMLWGVPTYAKASVDKPAYYIVALKNHVNLGFSLKGLTKDDCVLFDGGGKTMKHLEITSSKDIDKKRIVSLLKLIEERQK